MRKLLLAMYMSLDGYIEGPNREFTGPPFTPDLKSKWIDVNIDRAGIMLYGRTAYEGMAGYWTSPAADPDEAAILAKADKIVFSTTLQRADWGNVRIIGSDIAGEVARLKAEPGRDLVLFGGAVIATSLLGLGLVDEMRLLVSPVLMGGGKRLFQGGYPRSKWTLHSAEPFDSGGVLLSYGRS